MEGSEFSVQAQSLQALYSLYCNQGLAVNRSYQRKLVWSVDEKVKLIDSVVNGLPISMILLAQRKKGGADTYEIIDGLQRLNAFFSFVENQFSYNGEYFDLDVVEEAKARLDMGMISPGDVKMSRALSLGIAKYQIPVAVYLDSATPAVNEIFRRINSGGRQLSPQEVRQAGAVGPLADLVRRASASIRGDGTFSESISLDEMEKLSTSRRGVEGGLSIEEVFWVRHGIVTQEEIRSSVDEEVILDLVLDAVVRPWPASGWQARNIAYGLPQKISAARLDEVNAAVADIEIEVLHQRILSVIELIDDLMRGHGSLACYMATLGNREKSARWHFQAIFYAFYSLMFEVEMAPRSHEAIRSVLGGFWDQRTPISTRETAWGASEKGKLYPHVLKRLREAFYHPEATQGAVRLNSRLYIERILQGPVSEDPLIELKQGFCSLSDVPKEDVEIFEKILQTAVAMANFSKNSEGLILIGVADKPSAADRASRVFGLDPLQVSGQLVIGTSEQIQHLGYDVDSWWRKWQAMIRSSKLALEFSNKLAESFKPVLCDDKLLWEMRPKSIGRPIAYGGRFFVRIGSSTEELGADDFLAHMKLHFSGAG
ncbi:DUF262 domain-containing protein [Kitasatospora sp. NPDC056273]|uniref:GmrSD restriction endonuclease domain-containing protein n=1 Tax=Kitasatospora sp. NPDC056273 TaxID=3345769 RepID=UPI0035DFC2E2